MFKRRVGGVYFAIITQALAAVLTILIVGQQGYTGGINGITDLRTLLGWDIRTDHAKFVLYFVCVAAAARRRCCSRARSSGSKLGRILVAVRDKEDRVRFSGYDVANFKMFVFCLAAAIAAIGGAMFTLQVGFMSPSFVGIVPSIDMVIFCAVGGRHSLVGAVVRNAPRQLGQDAVLRELPGTLAVRRWAALFIAVVLAFPRGLAGLDDRSDPAAGSNSCAARARTASAGRPQRRRRAGIGDEPPCPSSTDFLLALENVTVSFDGFKAVNDLNLYVDKNELRVIIGPNGAGKTTVLDLICGRTKVTEGSIKFKDQEITGLKEHQIVRRGIGRKFQTPSIYEDLTVFENLEISVPRGRDVAGALFWKRTPEVIERVREVARMIFLEEQLDRLAETLSHGQKQWLEIGMLLMQDPELLMLDEPVAGMSVSERARTAELLELVSKGRSVIVIEHDMKFVESIADRVTVLHQGKVLAEGSMATIQDNAQVKEVYLGH